MVVLAASICTRGGKPVLSRQFREIARSRVEGLLAAFPKLADSGTQHTTVEQDNVRYVYQPLDELYMVLITNRQSNILQDIDSLHLFAQIVTSICNGLEEREITRHAYELLSAFDEVVNHGFRENLNLGQIKTFLEMESHEERIQEIISRNKELEATEERKRKAKQLELQRKEAARSSRNAMPRAPSYPTYTPPQRVASHSTYDSYEAEKNKSRPTTVKKGMQLGKKNKTDDMFARVRNELGPEVEVTPLIAPIVPTEPKPAPSSRDAVHIVIGEQITGAFDKEGSMKSLNIKGDLQLRISDPDLTKIGLDLVANSTHNAQFKTHPNVDKTAFTSSKSIRMKDAAKGFPTSTPVGVLRWTANLSPQNSGTAPITFTVWVNKGSNSSHTITVEYELTGTVPLDDVIVTIPFASGEPNVSSFEAQYEVSSDTLEWTIGNVTEENASGTLEFEAAAEDEAEFFPMNVRFLNTKPLVDVDVKAVKLLGLEQGVDFSKDVRSVAEVYSIEQD